MRAALLIALIPALSACQTTAASRCLESICVDVPSDSVMTHADGRHTIRPAGWPGWLDIQAIEPITEGPASLDEASQLLSDRLTGLGNARVLSTGHSTVGGENVAALDVEVTWRGEQYRRLIYIAHPNGEWLTLDVTSAANRVDDARRAWQPVLHAAHWMRSR